MKKSTKWKLTPDKINKFLKRIKNKVLRGERIHKVLQYILLILFVPLITLRAYGIESGVVWIHGARLVLEFVSYPCVVGMLLFEGLHALAARGRRRFFKRRVIKAMLATSEERIIGHTELTSRIALNSDIPILASRVSEATHNLIGSTREELEVKYDSIRIRRPECIQAVCDESGNPRLYCALLPMSRAMHYDSQIEFDEITEKMILKGRGRGRRLYFLGIFVDAHDRGDKELIRAGFELFEQMASEMFTDEHCVIYSTPFHPSCCKLLDSYGLHPNGRKSHSHQFSVYELRMDDVQNKVVKKIKALRKQA